MLLDIAMHTHGDDQPVSIKEIADRQGISMKYLEKLIRVLKGAGYMLARPPESILLGDVVFALEETVPTFECVDPEPCCPRMDYCLTRTIWNEAAKAMYEKLNSFTLADLINDAELCPKQGQAC
jgi:Rrf2 family protein